MALRGRLDSVSDMMSPLEYQRESEAADRKAKAATDLQASTPMRRSLWPIACWRRGLL